MAQIIAFRLRCEARALLGALALTLALGGCSMPIPGFIDDTSTGSIKSKSYPFAEEDWSKVQPALIAAIRANAGVESAKWINSASGRRGTVAAVGARYARSGAQCRSFVARIDAADDKHAFQGEACEKRGAVTVSDAGPFGGV